MKTLLITLFSLFSIICYGQGNYEKAMSDALQSWKEGKSTDAMSKFERIAQAEKDNWIPRYYQAMVASTSSFQTQDVKEKTKLIDAALQLIPTQSEALNAEWYVLKAITLTAQLVIDPMTTAMTLSPQIIEAYESALELEPNNPRALSGLAEFQIQSKKYMGGSTEKECKDLEKAVSLYAAEKHETAFYPSWGKESAESALANCKK
ncbi:hypothetical protein GQF61_08650 [Sphingobacterium sp. DK4209]|uniref:Tetratricopeptide repeat protein n=1 Tax=Sphingobacterium zhuxiongii TaxID=2662364 RepID=A0A5Q0QFH2_9SPHI|nr:MULTISPECIES: hypothetical protein [unclassified Sphingobacterium]MVZ65925.1 hypothetical protein [Sphingobacterium sp. DK4209]QGA28064.1 hypothetical protein GFH32_17785 [Sphingobacterium sp. dk4302]